MSTRMLAHAHARRVSAARRSPHDALEVYLREIGAYPLLSPDEEHALATRVAAGDHDAFEQLVRANLRFVVSIAKRYQNYGLSLADLIAEGNLGLIRATPRFDPTQHVRFVTYAVWWIRQAIQQALADQARVVRVPPSHAGALYRLSREASALEQELGRAVTSYEIAEATEVTVPNVQRALAFARAPVSFDAPLVRDTEVALRDLLTDEASEPPDAAVVEQARRAAIDASLASLREREARILRLYFGLDGEPVALEEIGRRLGITRERVRQIKERALHRLRSSDAGRALAQHY